MHGTRSARSTSEERTASAERTERAERMDRAGDDMGRLADAIQRMNERPGRRQREFKLPRFDGKSDVELFIQQFEEISEANDWNNAASRLHLKEALTEGARNCSRPFTTDGVIAALRARFGLTTREARAKLATLRKEHAATLQEHGVEVERLVAIAYADLDYRQREEMTLDLFITTLGHLQLQRHLLAVGAADLTAMIRAGNEFLQLQTGPSRGRHNVQTVDELEETSQQVAPVVSPGSETALAMREMMTVLQTLVSQLGSVGGRPKTSPKREGRPPPTCRTCGGVGHVQSKCTKSISGPQAGNANRPQQ